jgi:hypothetical protein
MSCWPSATDDRRQGGSSAQRCTSGDRWQWFADEGHEATGVPDHSRGSRSRRAVGVGVYRAASRVESRAHRFYAARYTASNRFAIQKNRAHAPFRLVGRSLLSRPLAGKTNGGGNTLTGRFLRGWRKGHGDPRRVTAPSKAAPWRRRSRPVAVDRRRSERDAVKKREPWWATRDTRGRCRRRTRGHHAGV